MSWEFLLLLVLVLNFDLCHESDWNSENENE